MSETVGEWPIGGSDELAASMVALRGIYDTLLGPPPVGLRRDTDKGTLLQQADSICDRHPELPKLGEKHPVRRR